MKRTPLVSARYAKLKLRRDERMARLVLELPIRDAGDVLDLLGSPPPSSRLHEGRVVCLPVTEESGDPSADAIEAMLTAIEALEVQFAESLPFAERLARLAYLFLPGGPMPVPDGTLAQHLARLAEAFPSHRKPERPA